MADLKPIETIYKGNRFRSRLEAKWAAYFDAVGVEYQYEPEGFQLNNGTWYLPDFFLPGKLCKNGTYVEIKSLGALDVKNKRIVDGREQADKYNAAIETLTHSDAAFALCVGSPWETQNQTGGISLVWCGEDMWWMSDHHDIPYDNIAAKIVNGFRFDGRDKSYALEQIKQIRHEQYTGSLKRERIEQAVLGMIMMHPEYSSICINAYSDTVSDCEFGYKWVEPLVWELHGQTHYNLSHPDTASNYDQYFKPDDLLPVNLFDIWLLEAFAEERKQLTFGSPNNIDAFKVYVDAMRNLPCDEQEDSLAKILARRMGGDGDA